MAAGDYVIRRNTSNTDTIPNTGSDLLALWDTAVASVGSISYSAGTFTLGETGKYLVLASDQAGTTDTTNNERLNWKMTLNLGGTELVEGYSTGYIRKSSGSQEFITSAAAIIDVASTTGSADELQVRLERIDNTTTSGREPDRIADRSGISILKLDDSWDYGRYTASNQATSGTDNAAVSVLDGTTEQDATFTRTGANVDVATSDLVLAVYSLKSESPTASGRTEFQGRLTQAGSALTGSWSQCYFRVTDNCDWGGMSAAVLIDPTSGDDIALEIVSRDSGGETFVGALQLVRLPAATKAIIVEATTGNMNVSGSNFTWDTLPYIDSDVFTHTAGQANLDVDSAGDYLALASLADTTSTGSSATRAVPAHGFRVNTTDLEHAGNSVYNRSSGTSDHSANAWGGVISGLSGGDSVYARGARIGTNSSTITNSAGAMSLIQLDSLFAAASQAVALNSVAGSLTILQGTVTPQTVGAHKIHIGVREPVDSIISTGLHGWWKMDEASGFPQDSSGNGNHFDGVWITPTYQQEGPLGSQSNSSGDLGIWQREGSPSAGFFTLSDGRTPGSDAADFSVACWAKIENMTVDSTDSHDPDVLILSTGTYGTNGFRFWFGANAGGATTDALMFHNMQDTAFNASVGAVYDFGASVDTLGWVHVAATHDFSTKEVKLYVDGALVETATLTTAITDAADAYDHHNAYRGAGGDATFDAVYSDLIFSTNILTAAQVAALYSGGTYTAPGVTGSLAIQQATVSFGSQSVGLNSLVL